MSGTGANLPINIRLTGTAEAEAAFNRVSTTAGTAMQRVEQSTNQAGAATGRFGQVVGQAGFQIQDFAGQVGAGQSALTALSQQGSQLLGVFGTGGAVAGAVLTVGILAAQLSGMASSSDKLKDALDALDAAYQTTDASARQYRDSLDEEARRIRDLTAYYGSLSESVAVYEQRRLTASARTLRTERDERVGEIVSPLQGVIGAARGDVSFDALGNSLGTSFEGAQALTTELERARQAVTAFQAEVVPTKETVAALFNTLTDLGRVSGPTGEAIRSVLASLTANEAALLRTGEGMEQLRQRMQAAGIPMEEIARQLGVTTLNADQLSAALGRLRNAANNPIGTLGQSLSDVNEELRALRTGGVAAADRAVREQRMEAAARTARQQAEAFVRSNSGLGGSQLAEAIKAEADAAEAIARAAVSGRQSIERLREQLTAAGRAAREASQEFQDLRQHTSGLLVGNSSDARVAGEIAALPAVRAQQAFQAARSRQEAETARTAEREETARQNEANRFTQNWGDRLALETTRGLFEGTKNGETFFQRIGNSLKNILISAASSALSANVFQPLIASVTGGNVSSGGMSLSGLFGGSTARPGQPAGGGGVTDTGSSLGTLRRAYDGFTSPGGLGSYFPGGMGVNTGFGAADSVLNASLIAPSGVDAATNTALGAMGGQFGPATPGALMGAGAAPGLTVASALGPAAAVAGGAYGVYSGIQRGGVGGYTSAAGGAVSAVTGLGMLGAAAGLLPALGVLGPIGLAIGAVLAIAGALMPGAKPSGQGQLARTNLNSGLETTEGLGGKRFSAGNATAAGSTVDNIVTLAKEIGAKLGGASIGGDVAVGVTNGNIYLDINGQKTNAANSEQGAKDIAAAAATMVLNEFRGQGTVGGEYQGIVAGSGSLDALNANLEWYEKTYQVVTEATPKVSAFEQSLKALSDQFGPNIEKARELSLSVEAMTVARDRELQKLTTARDAQLRSFEQSLEVRGQRLMGNNEWADTLAFNLQAETFLADTRKSLEDLGLSAETVADRMSRAEAVLAGERLQIQRQYADQALASQQQAEQQAMATRQAGAGGALGVVTSLRDYAASLTTGEAGGGTALDRLAASQRQFDAVFGAASAGDARSISGLQGAAETFRINSREVFGGGQGFADAVSLIGRRIDAIGDLGADALTQSFMIENARQNTDRVVDMLAALRADINMLMMRPAVAA